MWFIGLLAGLILGAVLFGFEGAVICGFLGWVVGLVLGPKNKTVAEAQAGKADRLSAIEQRLLAIEQRLAAVERRANKAGVSETSLESASQGVIADVRAIAPISTHVDSVQKPVQTGPDQVRGDEKSVAAGTIEPAIMTDQIARERPPGKSVPPSAPAKPNPIVAWFTGGNAIVRIGIVILFFGVAFLVKYAAEHALFPVELRLASAAAGAIAMLFVGWRVREKNPGFGLTLQGGAVGILYLTIFGAFRIWHFLPPGAAFALLVGIAVLSAFLAVRQDAMALAVAGSAGGFLAPILASTGGGSHVMLFSYYAVLNAGILAIAWHKAWRPLNLVGFVFTFAIGLLWGARFYRPELFESTEPFLVLFFLFYVVIAVLYALRQAPQLKHFVDGTLIFGTPLVGFGLQAALVRDFEYGLAISSLVLAAFYLLLAQLLYLRRRENLRLLVESFLALGVIFATLTIPLALDARWTSAFWALEGAAVLWAGLRQQRFLARLFGLLLQLIAGLAFVHGYGISSAPQAIVNSIFIGATLLSFAGLFVSRMLSRDPGAVTVFERGIAPLLFLWGVAWWLFAGLREIHRFIEHDYRFTIALVFFAATAIAFSWLHHRRQWREAAWPVRAFLPVMLLAGIFGAADHGHPFANFGWIVWPLAIAAHYAMLRKLDDEDESALASFLHAASLVALAALGAWEVHWLSGEYDLQHSAWSVTSLILFPGLLLLAASSNRMRSRWPVEQYPHAYLVHGALPMVIVLWLWTFYANLTHDGASLPLPYLPLINAIDLGHFFVLLVALKWVRRIGAEDSGVDFPLDRTLAAVAGSAAAFVWLNAILLRSIHHWADVPYRLDTMANSVLVQTALSIFWTVLALVLMFLATRNKLRAVWMTGAALMAVVVGKLFMVDLSHIAGIERIVSFIGVGVLMLVIGYFSPMPPALAENKDDRP